MPANVANINTYINLNPNFNPNERINCTEDAPPAFGRWRKKLCALPGDLVSPAMKRMAAALKFPRRFPAAYRFFKFNDMRCARLARLFAPSSDWQDSRRRDAAF